MGLLESCNRQLRTKTEARQAGKQAKTKPFHQPEFFVKDNALSLRLALFQNIYGILKRGFAGLPRRNQ